MVYQFNNIRSGRLFIFLVVILTIVCTGFFYTTKTLNFYILFELSIPPTLFIIILYGYQPEKLSSRSYLVLYTVLSSLPILLILVNIPAHLFHLNPNISLYIILSVTFGFTVKTPMYLVHMWLPKAHVEAPVAGSMVLAGVILKLGRYGLLVFLPLFLHWVLYFYLCVSVVGGFICCLSCVRQWDIKGLIAYSSVVHIGVVTVGLVTGRELGFCCGLVMMIAHGVCSPLLFGVAFFIYGNSHTRVLPHNRGYLGSPLLVCVLFCLLAVNIGLPPFLNV